MDHLFSGSRWNASFKHVTPPPPPVIPPIMMNIAPKIAESEYAWKYSGGLAQAFPWTFQDTAQISDQNITLQINSDNTVTSSFPKSSGPSSSPAYLSWEVTGDVGKPVFTGTAAINDLLPETGIIIGYVTIAVNTQAEDTFFQTSGWSFNIDFGEAFTNLELYLQSIVPTDLAVLVRYAFRAIKPAAVKSVSIKMNWTWLIASPATVKPVTQGSLNSSVTYNDYYFAVGA